MDDNKIFQLGNWSEKYQHMEKMRLLLGQIRVHGLKWMDVWILMNE
jgi:hypothetical protein